MVGTLPNATNSPAPVEMLERSAFVVALDERLVEAAGGRGHLVLIAGEAGIGKSVLVQRFCEKHREGARILWGACDGLHMPRPLGPLVDIAAATRGPLEEVIERGGKPPEVFAALVDELRATRPTIAVVEDIHWADEATLDILRLLGRRVESTQALVIATYRDDELDRAHPLRIVVGELGTAAGVRRLELPRLSLEAVKRLAAPYAVDADDLYRKTIGNPFFVTEVLAVGKVDLPPSVRDAVLARAARLSASARDLLETIAVVTPRLEMWLLEALAGEEIGHLDAILTSGMLRHDGRAVAFRNELARLAIEDSISPHRSVILHREALAALRNPVEGKPDPARLAHHAEAAGDAEAVLEFAPEAAAQAASLGAHREAAAQYARALRFGDGLPPEERAELLDLRSHECFLTDQYEEAIEALEHAIELYSKLGSRRKEADSLSALSQTLWCPGRTAEAEEAAKEAVAMLEPLPPGRELAMAYSNLSVIYKDAEDAEEAVAWGNRALELAQRLDNAEIVVHALITIGGVDFLAGAPEGAEKLERALELAEQAGLNEEVGRAFVHLAWGTVRRRLHALANGYVESGVDYCSERGLELFRLYLLGFRARSELDQGRWAEAVDSAALVLRAPRTSTIPRIHALVVLGLVRARSGDPEQWAPLEEALALAEPSGELQRIAPVAAARAEAAWLGGRRDRVREMTETALDLAVRRRASWIVGELGYWRWRAGIQQEVSPGAAEPFAHQMAGNWSRAAELWMELGCPYEAALALADADDNDALRRGLGELQRLGARPGAAMVARRLRERGARGLPRGPRLASRQNPANLTPRELDVLALVAKGLRNSEIAERLFLSQKTVDHHVSAILRKLGVGTRTEASAEASRLEIVFKDR